MMNHHNPYQPPTNDKLPNGADDITQPRVHSMTITTAWHCFIGSFQLLAYGHIGRWVWFSIMWLWLSRISNKLLDFFDHIPLFLSVIGNVLLTGLDGLLIAGGLVAAYAASQKKPIYVRYIIAGFKHAFLRIFTAYLVTMLLALCYCLLICLIFLAINGTDMVTLFMYFHLEHFIEEIYYNFLNASVLELIIVSIFLGLGLAGYIFLSLFTMSLILFCKCHITNAIKLSIYGVAKNFLPLCLSSLIWVIGIAPIIILAVFVDNTSATVIIVAALLVLSVPLLFNHMFLMFQATFPGEKAAQHLLD